MATSSRAKSRCDGQKLMPESSSAPQETWKMIKIMTMAN